jgi:hypothetical protein
MSEKLTTDKLRLFIVERISDYVKEIENNRSSDELTSEESNIIINNWKRPSYWKRTSKKKIKDDWDEYFYQDEVNSDYGWLDKEVYNGVIENNQTEKCIIRIFQPEDERMRDNYYIFIISNPEDTTVVAFGLHQD